MQKLIYLFLFCFPVIFFPGCTSTRTVTDKNPDEIWYSLIYVIHGDSNYTYHLNGERYQADINAVNRAIKTAQKATQGEVLIFHQKPEKKLLFLFPQKDRLFYHFRNGELIGGKSYSPAGGGLKAEAELYKSSRSVTAERNIFLYFGHEIPGGNPNLVYHQSQPYSRFNTDIFSVGLSLFGGHFDLTILSTCNNGNPVMVDALTGMTDFLVASPQNLHLSHLTDEPLHLLESDPDIPTKELADSVAKQSFNQLSDFLQTMITVAVYNLEETGKYIHSLAMNYRNHLENITQNSLFIDNTDCRELPGFDNSLPGEGITLYYKPPAFGRKSAAGGHSGWGCKN